MSILGDRLKVLRNSLDINQEELGKKLNVTKQTVSGWETGYRTPDILTLNILADLFNCTVDYLIGRTDNKNSKAYTSTLDEHNYTIEIDKGLKQKITFGERFKALRLEHNITQKDLADKFLYMENTNIGKKIQILRENLNLTQKELAEKIGVTDATMSRYENNKREPKAEILGRLALVFNTTTDYLIGLTDNKNAKVYTTTVDGKNYTIEIDKGLKQEITQDELNEMIRKLKAVGFDVNKLLDKENHSN